MSNSRMFTGLILIAIGAVFLASQLGWISVDPGEIAATYWPVALILFGLSGLIGRGRCGGGGWPLVWNGIVIFLGAFFLLNNLGLIEISVGELVRLAIPVAVIAFGIRMLLRPSGEKPPQDYSYKYEYKYEYNPQKGESASGFGKYGYKYEYGTYKDESNTEPGPRPQKADAERSGNGPDAAFFGAAGADVPPPPGYGESAPPPPRGFGKTENRSEFFGDLYLGHNDWELKPMNVSHFIGDTVIDLTKARIPAGETKLNISSFIGDVKVFAPNDIDVEFSISANSLLGDMAIFRRRESGFFRSVREESPNYQLAEKRIRIQISLFIGDVYVQRVG